MIKKGILFSAILLILVFQFSFVSAECFPSCFGSKPICSGGVCISQAEADAIITGFGESKFLDFGISFMDLVGGKIWGTKEGIKYDKIGEEGNRFSFIGENTSLNIGESSFENILPQGQAGHSSYIELDNLGNITKADFTVNKKGGSYLINGIKFDAPPNSRVYYDSEKGFRLSEGTKITSIKKLDGQKISGTNINFLDELNLDGELEINKDGYLINKGKAIYEGMNIDSGSDGVLIFKGSGQQSDYKGNWIKKTSNGLDIQSIEDDSFDIEFLKDNEVFDMSNYGKLKMTIGDGDGLRITKTEKTTEILHKSSENGFTYITGGDLIIYLDGTNLLIDTESITVYDILSGQYRSVPYSLTSDSPDMKISRKEKSSFILDSNGKGILNTIKGINTYQTEFSKQVLERLNNEDITSIAQVLKDNAGTKADDLLNANLPETLSLASNAGFNNGQSIRLFNGVVGYSKEDSWMAFEDINKFLPELKGRENLDQITDTLLKTVKIASDRRNSQLVEYSNQILLEALNNKIDLDLTTDYIDKAYKYNILATDFLTNSLGEYDGSNFEKITKGISLSNKYGLSGVFAKDFNLHMTNIKDEESLGKEYARAINEKVSKGIDSKMALSASQYIDAIHTAEEDSSKTDKIRQIIAADLTDTSKYYLMAYTVGGTDNMFSSTYDALYNTLPPNFVNKIKIIDPKGENVAAFAMHALELGKLDKFIKQDPNYFINAIKENLEASDIKKLKSASSFLTDTLIDYYDNPEYKSQKEDIEKFLVDKFNTADSAESKATYGYLLKLDENTNNPDVLKITNKLPEISNMNIPQKWLDRKELSGTLYFYDDEASFGSSISEFQKTYGMSLVKNGENSAVLTQKVGDKTIKLDLELIPKTQKANSKETIENDKDILVAHRGHSYHLESTFSGQSLTDKILYLGSCSSYSAVPSIQEDYPNTQVVSVQGTGVGDINNAAIYYILKNIASGKSSWEQIAPTVDKFAKNTKLVFPNNPSITLNKYVANAVWSGF